VQQELRQLAAALAAGDGAAAKRIQVSVNPETETPRNPDLSTLNAWHEEVEGLEARTSKAGRGRAGKDTHGRHKWLRPNKRVQLRGGACRAPLLAARSAVFPEPWLCLHTLCDTAMLPWRRVPSGRPWAPMLSCVYLLMCASPVNCHAGRTHNYGVDRVLPVADGAQAPAQGAVRLMAAPVAGSAAAAVVGQQITDAAVYVCSRECFGLGCGTGLQSHRTAATALATGRPFDVQTNLERRYTRACNSKSHESCAAPKCLKTSHAHRMEVTNPTLSPKADKHGSYPSAPVCSVVP
jgi:hypothetical protein